MKLEFCFIILIKNLLPVLSLSIVMFDVPSHSKNGDSVELSCIYDLKKDRLYSVKVSDLANLREKKCWFSLTSCFNLVV